MSRFGKDREGSDQERKKISGGLVETRSQNSSEDKKAMLEVEIHPKSAQMRIGRDVEQKEMGTGG